jgi:hypothetical protein
VAVVQMAEPGWQPPSAATGFPASGDGQPPPWELPRQRPVPADSARPLRLRRWPVVLCAVLIGLWVTTALTPSARYYCGDRPTIAVAFGGGTADADFAGWCESLAQNYLWFQTVTMLIAPAVILGWWGRGYRRGRRSPTPVRPGLLHRNGPRLWPLIVGAMLVLLALTWSFLPVDDDYRYSCDVRPLVTLAVGLEDDARAVCRGLARDEMTGVPLWSLLLGLPLLAWGDRGRRNAARPDRRTRVRSERGGRRDATAMGREGHHSRAWPLRTSLSSTRAGADAAPAAAFLSFMTRASRGVSIAMVCVVGVLFVILPEPDLVVTGIGTAVMILTWTRGVRKLRAVAVAPHRPARLVTKQAQGGGGGWECTVDVTMEDGAVQRLPLHVEQTKPPSEFPVAMLPTGKIVRVGRFEQLADPLFWFASGAFLCVAGLHGVGVVELLQDG